MRPGRACGTSCYRPHSCEGRGHPLSSSDGAFILLTEKPCRGQTQQKTHKPKGFFGLFSILVCDVLPLIINNPDVRLPASLLYKYLNKAAEFYINYVTRSTQTESQYQGKNTLTKSAFPRYISVLLKRGAQWRVHYFSVKYLGDKDQ